MNAPRFAVSPIREVLTREVPDLRLSPEAVEEWAYVLEDLTERLGPMVAEHAADRGRKTADVEDVLDARDHLLMRWGRSHQ